MILLRLIGFPFVLLAFVLMALFFTLGSAVAWLANGDPYQVKVTFPNWR